ncbi:hypothetical protein [Cupriavidus sp. D39]|uniref:type II toxin-antitoxin system RelE/ParE family toxin n=1 Tax=Cupriavidus sp. D39 TaxID=2997877 RepID=UPI002D1E3538|nr:hypothetical protein [Cupriavidus sp. D39]
MTTLNRTAEFSAWLLALQDLKARAKILTRLKRAEQGNFGDSEPIGEGLSEMRIDLALAIASITAVKALWPTCSFRVAISRLRKPTSSELRKCGKRSRRSHHE